MMTLTDAKPRMTQWGRERVERLIAEGRVVTAVTLGMNHTAGYEWVRVDFDGASILTRRKILGVEV